jgi:hypothetical protein
MPLRQLHVGYVSHITGGMAPGTQLQTAQFLHGDSLEVAVDLPILPPSEHPSQFVVRRATTVPALPCGPAVHSWR